MKSKKKPLEKYKGVNTKNLLIFTILLSLIPLISILQRVFTGDFAFWYDPARDLLTALTNLQKPTLIGPTSGIPGVFYGPYWIWLLSIGQLFSKDPRVVMIIVITIPYLILFPFILSKFNTVLRPTTIAIIWLLFLLHYNYYFTDLWNPYPAPLLMLATILLLFKSQYALERKNLLLFFSAGITAGLLVNFHLSLGIGMMLGIILYLLVAMTIRVIHSKTKLQTILYIVYLYGTFALGFVLAFLPYIVFEIRHQFQQTQALLNAFMSYGGVVTLQGLSKVEIINNFLERGATLTHVSIPVFVIVFLFLTVLYILYVRRCADRKQDLTLLSITLSIFLGISFIYLTARNPIWDYHFTGIEILFLIIIGILINKIKWFKAGLGIWIIILLVTSASQITESISTDAKKKTGTLSAKQYIVQGIINDVNSDDYAFYSLNPSIYMFDYSYLFKQLGNKDISYDPGSVPQAKFIYLIIPPESKNVEDFMNYRAPKSIYKSEKQSVYPDGTLVVKFIRVK